MDNGEVVNDNERCFQWEKRIYHDARKNLCRVVCVIIRPIGCW